MPRRPGPPSPAQLDTTAVPEILLVRDYPRRVVEAHLRRGMWVRVRPGAFVRADALPEAGTFARQRAEALARLAAVHRQLSTPLTLSHESAALVHGLPTQRAPMKTHLIQPSNPGRYSADDLVRHVHELAAAHRTVHRGLPVTTPERTVVDVAMLRGVLAGLVVADATLHTGADLMACLEIVGGMAGRHGAPAARAVLAVADGGSESPGETRTRLVFLRGGLPAPMTQIPVTTSRGTYWCDMGWEEWRTVVEYDGVAKYSANGAAADAVIAEKQRQEAIEEAGWRMLRTYSEDLRRPRELVGRLCRLADVTPPLLRRELFG